MTLTDEDEVKVIEVMGLMIEIAFIEGWGSAIECASLKADGINVLTESYREAALQRTRELIANTLLKGLPHDTQ